MEKQAILAIGIFLLTYAFIISEKVHRTIVAMVGGVVMVTLGVVSQESALHHIDFNTIGLLAGMMIIVAITGETGLFQYVAIAAAKRANGDPLRILISLGIITAVFSAFLDNVTTVLLMVPVTFSIARQLKVNLEPYLITEIITSNIGGTATLIGDPPNIMIGSAVKELSFMSFINNLALISLVTMAVSLLVLLFVYRNQLKTTEELKSGIMDLNEKKELKDKVLLMKSLIVLGLTISGFFLHQLIHLESATVALGGAFVLLLITNKSEHDLEHIFNRIEWTTIFFFIGLFVVVSGLVETGIISSLAQGAIELTGGNIKIMSILILWLSALASAFIDNIPFVATMIPMIQDMGTMGITNLEPLWWSLALGACFGGNGSLIGASANLIVVGLAAQEGTHISFLRFLAVGFPIMVLSVILANIYIYVRYLIV
ncbi:ArsB/NhaD family transporter [Sporomusa acidovorans]|uniref:Transporter n=1 Tax=Sporomusa acidovorans (strain ATCC 49682 / DSM 3132 / Mol) TaxID=1123286 RepID=A0ABZ3IWM6_SPOA4|nr:ArsB/NhaD family transporter [Sporomusa acidovorans]OZC23886.1 Na(+)/H(+) antiporter NhaD [Sporomusa acidovorans DSM 3132]SDF54334.1 Na+/H+ antiporter NhaD [Sporomusa acidovorans]